MTPCDASTINPARHQLPSPGGRHHPSPGPGEVLIHVAFAGVTGPTCFSGRAATAAARCLPLPGAGGQWHGHRCGRGGDRTRRGDTVCALTPGGGYADYVTAPAGHCLPVPRTSACASRMPAGDDDDGLAPDRRGRLQAGQRVLIHGGSSGIGTTPSRWPSGLAPAASSPPWQ